ncbi:alr1733 [Nostoc sp. PCC 7120 = FACHB-418]|nr:alr1733 [Nostoc sp. PCC 7120 = FACHB-418]
MLEASSSPTQNCWAGGAGGEVARRSHFVGRVSRLIASGVGFPLLRDAYANRANFGGERDFFAAINLAKFSWQTTREEFWSQLSPLFPFPQRLIEFSLVELRVYAMV